MVSDGENSDCFQDHWNWEFESKEVILQQIQKSEDKNVLVIWEISTLPRPSTLQKQNVGKDKNKEQDGETAISAKNITSPQDAHQTNRDLSQEREAWDTALAKTIAKAVAREMTKAHVHYQALLNERSAPVIPTSLKVTSRANGLRLWTPLTGQRTKLSTRDGNCGQRRLDSSLMLQKVTQKRLRFHAFTIGSMEREWDTLSHGKTTKLSFASLID